MIVDGVGDDVPGRRQIERGFQGLESVRATDVPGQFEDAALLRVFDQAHCPVAFPHDFVVDFAHHLRDVDLLLFAQQPSRLGLLARFLHGGQAFQVETGHLSGCDLRPGAIRTTLPGIGDEVLQGGYRLVHVSHYHAAQVLRFHAQDVVGVHMGGVGIGARFADRGARPAYHIPKWGSGLVPQ